MPNEDKCLNSFCTIEKFLLTVLHVNFGIFVIFILYFCICFNAPEAVLVSGFHYPTNLNSLDHRIYDCIMYTYSYEKEACMQPAMKIPVIDDTE